MIKKPMNKWFILVIISLGGGIIYNFPYIQYTFYDSMMESLGFNHTQMGNVMSVYGTLNLIAYFLGGVFADKFSSRILITFSLIMTGISGFWFATGPTYTGMILLSVIWSFTTIFTYWPAVIKAVKLLGTSEEQGRMFGFKEALNSFAALLFSSLGLVIFNKTGESFSALVIAYSIFYILSGVFTFIFLPKDKKSDNEEKVEEKQSIFAGLGYVLKSPSVWLVGFVIFFGYAIGSTMGRLTPYLTSVFHMSVSTAAIVGILNTYAVGNVGAVAGGIMADKLKSSTKFLMYCFVVMAVVIAIFILVPGNPKFLMVAIVVGLSVRLVQTAVRGVYFAPIDEIKIPDKYLGTAAGVVSVIGFLPDSFLFTIWGKILDTYPGELGYKIMFGSLIGFCLVGFILTLILSKRIKKVQLR